ncbi:hypothetical protein GUITHDRAFT_106817 [Guillardia theta CCMP2712]|uniref:Secreted protein n=1 Tax=Guillardia theta (strain CCMP2712) TaxID=905079 RepID=L1JFV7_GUITC|nr:hypothetical protein GUITHDRAFT_106817 [Guillardia theta CCMP2712]EKX47371.1 hypothetical protein GUITHDRAFT_106817 [Guillardia theta CCMP2712]|eukprot:XP_005834351.1 hypothetical protein GUITHDRAFT_106817 [Guillardia theta CCMP2712]
MLAAAALACLCVFIPNQKAAQSEALQSLWGGRGATREKRPDHYPGISYFAKQREEDWHARHTVHQTNSETVRGPNNQKLTGNQARIAKKFQALRGGGADYSTFKDRYYAENRREGRLANAPVAQLRESPRPVYPSRGLPQGNPFENLRRVPMPANQQARQGYVHMMPEHTFGGYGMTSRWQGDHSQGRFREPRTMFRSRRADGGFFRQSLNEEPAQDAAKEDEANPEVARASGDETEDQGEEGQGNEAKGEGEISADTPEISQEGNGELGEEGANDDGGHDDNQVKDEWGVPLDGNGDPSPLHYQWDIPSDHPLVTEKDRMDAIRKAEEKIEEGQKELRDEWKELMKHPPDVSESTRPDIMDPDDFPTATEVFHKKHREMEEFRDALDAFVHDPQFNPFIVMKAHQIAKYGIPAPETDNIFVWRKWYREVLDKYQILKHEVEKIASGNWYSEESDYRRHELHRPGAYKHVWRNRDAWSPREGPPSEHSAVVETGMTNFTEISGEVGYNVSNATREEENGPAEVHASPVVSDLEGRVDKMEKELKELVRLVKDSKEPPTSEDQTARQNASEAATDATNSSKAEEREETSSRLKIGEKGKSLLYHGRSSSSAPRHKDQAVSTSEDKLFLHPPKEVERWLAKAFESAAQEDKGEKSTKSKLSSLSRSVQHGGDSTSKKSKKDGSFMRTGPSSTAHDGDPLAHVTKALLKANSKKERAAERLESKRKKINSPSLDKKFVGGKTMYIPRYDHKKTSGDGWGWLWG